MNLIELSDDEGYSINEEGEIEEEINQSDLLFSQSCMEEGEILNSITSEISHSSCTEISSESDLELDSMQRSILPVASLNDPSFDESEPPTSGQEYLRLVRLEYLRLPKYKNSTENLQLPIVDDSCKFQELSAEETEFLNQYTQFKLQLNYQSHDNFEVEHNSFGNEDDKIIEAMHPNLHDNDENGWFHYFYLKSSETLTLSQSIQLFQTLENKTLFSLLRYHRKWLNEHWEQITNHIHFVNNVYSILVCNRFPFTADEYFNLREIVKKLHEKTANEPDFSQQILSLELIARHFYGQKDLILS